jgi:aerobic-type carbon monoxide dehydrogenase small subunit (CoxS/CutS family)
VTSSATPVSVTLTVNGRSVTREAGGHLTLLRWLRDNADALDPKYACGEGICGACTVLVDGQPVSACIVLAAQVDGAEITTAAGLLDAHGRPNDLQESFHRHHAAQCGFCTPGMLMCAAAMLSEGTAGSREEIRKGLHGNLCRCTGYQHIVDAIEECAANEAAATR